MDNYIAIGLQVIVIGLPILISITFHEAAHGYVALRFGDDTALKMGRVTFNPLKHIDPIGTVLIPLLLILSGSKILFGYAKPVPVNFRRLRNPKRDMIFVAAAGPGTNLLLAIASAFILKLTIGFFSPAPYSAASPNLAYEIVTKTMEFSIFINCLLAVFNMFPIPPLDGGRVAVGLLPPALARPLAKVEPYGFFILIGLLFLLPILSAQLGMPINIFTLFLLPIVEFLMDLIKGIFGL